MACGARSIRHELPANEPHTTELSLNLKLLNAHLEVKAIDATLVNRRSEYRTRREHLQKRRDALHEREVLFKERIIR